MYTLKAKSRTSESATRNVSDIVGSGGGMATGRGGRSRRGETPEGLWSRERKAETTQIPPFWLLYLVMQEFHLWMLD